MRGEMRGQTIAVELSPEAFEALSLLDADQTGLPFERVARALDQLAQLAVIGVAQPSSWERVLLHWLFGPLEHLEQLGPVPPTSVPSTRWPPNRGGRR
jgi:hypothetical protein